MGRGLNLMGGGFEKGRIYISGFVFYEGRLREDFFLPGDFGLRGKDAIRERRRFRYMIFCTRGSFTRFLVFCEIWTFVATRETY